MPNVEPKTGHIDATGVAFMLYADRYREAAVALIPRAKALAQNDPVLYQLLCQSLELYLKSFIWLVDRIGRDQIRQKYMHNIETLWRDAKRKGIGKYAAATPLRDGVIALVGPYYKNRQFNYFDLDMAFRGFKKLKAEPRAIPALGRLTAQLARSLRAPISRAR